MNDSAVEPYTRTESDPVNPMPIPFRSLLPFMAITFCIAWIILGLFIFLPDRMANMFGQLTGQHPLFFLAVYAPAIAAIFVVLRRGGLHGLSLFLSRISLWRCSLAWYAFLILGIPLIFVAGSALKGTSMADMFPRASAQTLIVAVLFAMIKGPVEEFGWRGLALPLLQRKMAPVWAGILLGAIWGLWHLPAFYLSGTQQSGWSFAPFFLGCIALSVVVTRLFNSARGSILLPAFFHFAVMNPILPDAQPYDTYIFVVVAALVVLLNRKTMLTRQDAVKDVIPRAKPH